MITKTRNSAQHNTHKEVSNSKDFYFLISFDIRNNSYHPYSDIHSHSFIWFLNEYYISKKYSTDVLEYISITNSNLSFNFLSYYIKAHTDDTKLLLREIENYLDHVTSSIMMVAYNIKITKQLPCTPNDLLGFPANSAAYFNIKDNHVFHPRIPIPKFTQDGTKKYKAVFLSELDYDTVSKAISDLNKTIQESGISPIKSISLYKEQSDNIKKSVTIIIEALYADSYTDENIYEMTLQLLQMIPGVNFCAYSKHSSLFSSKKVYAIEQLPHDYE